MFLRFTKGKYDKNKALQYRKSVLLGGTLIMEYGDKIVGAAKMCKESDKCLTYEVCVVKDSEIEAKVIARYIKDMIGKSNKFSENITQKRRKYNVTEYEGSSLPIKAEIVFTRLN